MRIKTSVLQKIQDASIDTKNMMDSAYEVKQKEIMQKHVPEKYLHSLTEEEVKRSQKAGLIVGIVFIIFVIVIAIRWLL